MNAFSVVVGIVILSIIGPFVARLHKSSLVWITLAIVNLIIISVYVVVRDTWHPELRAAEN
jgi:hypothetical protein